MIRLIPTSVLRYFGFRQPSTSLAKLYFKYTAVVGFAFVAIYGGMGYLAQQKHSRFDFAFDWEESIPMIQPAVWIYLSVIGLFVLAPFALFKRDIHRLSLSLLLSMVTSGVIFWFFPAEVRWSRGVDGSGLSAQALSLMQKYDSSLNTLPSLHVVFATLFVYFIARRASKARFWLWAWCLMICASVVFVHQHHVLDIVSAWLLCLGAVWVVRRLPRSG